MRVLSNALETIKIGPFSVGPDHPPFIIAEMSGNHNGSLERALELVKVAAEAGAHAIKLQTYTADTMTIDLKEGEFYIDDKESLWYDSSLYELYKIAFTPWEWHQRIFELAAELGMVGFSSPFDATAIDFLESINAPAYKIASFELTDVELVAKAASTGKPIIMSTGMASLEDIETAVGTARKAGAKNLILLKCTSSYPATAEDANLATIPIIREAFDVQVGLSDHSMGLAVPCVAVALGATVIEKHFTTRRADGGVDSAFSLEPDELKDLREQSEAAWKSMGSPRFGGGSSEETSKKHRRSLYVVKDLLAGEVITRDNVRSIRPGSGLQIKYFEDILGQKVKSDTKRGTPVSWDLIR